MVTYLSQTFTAFVGGMVSFLSSRVLPPVPACFGYLGGLQPEEGRARRWHILCHGTGFVLGFSPVLLTRGVTVSAVGRLLYDLRFYLARIGGLVGIVTGQLDRLASVAIWSDFWRVLW